MSAGALPLNVATIAMPTPFSVGFVNAYLIKGDPLILIDAGVKTEEAYNALVRELGAHGVAPRDLDIILITHGHLDHVGLLGRLLEESDAQAYAHPHAGAQFSKYNELADETAEFLRAVMGECGAPLPIVDECLRVRDTYQPYGEQLVIGNALEDGARVGPFTAYHVPGHSSSDTLFVDLDSRVAFTGDHLLKGIHPNPLIRRPPPGQSRPKSLLEYRRSLLRTRSFALETCYPGHGQPITDHRAAIDNLLGRQEERAGKVLGFLRLGELTPYEVSRKLFPTLQPSQLYLGLSVALGFLELLEDRHQAQSHSRDGVLVFREAASPQERTLL